MKIFISIIALFFVVSCGHGHHKSGDHQKADGGMMCGGGDHEHKGHDHNMMMEKMDADKDGKITKAEFDKKHQEKFTEMDENKDGAISGDEVGSGKSCGCGAEKHECKMSEGKSCSKCDHAKKQSKEK